MPIQTVIPPTINSTAVFAAGNLPEIRIASASDLPAPTAIVGGAYDGVLAHQIEPNFYYKINTSPGIPFFISSPIFLKFPSVGGPITDKIRFAAMEGIIVYTGIVPLFIAPPTAAGLFFLGGEQLTIIDCTSGPADLVDFKEGVLAVNSKNISFGAASFGKVFDCDNFIYVGEPSFVGSNSEPSFTFHNINNQLSISSLSIFSPSGGKAIFKISGNIPSLNISRNPVFDTQPTDIIFDISPTTDLGTTSIKDNGVRGSTTLFKAGITGIITSFVDNGGGDTLVNSINSFSGGEEIYIIGQNGYRHAGYLVSTSPVPTGTTFELNDRDDVAVPFVLADDGPGTWDTGSLNEKSVGIFASNNSSFPDGKVFGDILMSGNVTQTLFTGVGNTNPNEIQGIFSSQDNDMITSYTDGSMIFDGIRPGLAIVTASMVIFKDSGAIKDYVVRLVKNDDLSDVVLGAWDVPREFSTLKSSFTYLGIVKYEQGDKIQFWLEGVATTDPLVAELVNVVVRRI